MPDTNAVTTPTEYQKSLDEVRHLIDIPLRVVIELGRRSMKLRELLQLREDSILELSKSAGENIDIYVGGKLVAYGEVLEMEGRTGIRLTDLHTSA